jgi:hypothetical protein
LRSCIVSNNTSGGRGGGIFAYGDSLILISTAIARNTGATLGGAACIASGVVDFDHVTCAGNVAGPVAGIYVESATAPGRMRNSILAFNHSGGFVQASGAPAVLDWNTYWKNGDYDLIAATPGPHDTWEDPSFTDHAAGDHALGLHSPCIDAADVDGADPDGSRRDRGAYGGPQALAGQPPRIAGLVARRTPDGVRLTWDPALGITAATYVIHRGSAAGFRPSPTTWLGNVTTAGTAFMDEAAPSIAWYLVSVVDDRGHAGVYAVPVGATATTDAGTALTAFALHPVRPNPARHDAWIEFDLPAARAAVLEIFDARGIRVRRFATTPATGRQRLHWDGRDDRGHAVAAGTYWMRLVAGSDLRTAKLTWIR